MLNAKLSSRVESLSTEDVVHQNHYLGGRYENIYLAPESLPEVRAILDVAVMQGSRLLARSQTELRLGWRLNPMRPGDVAFAHPHDDVDELLSGVYYIDVPPDSGKLVLMEGTQRAKVQPREGMFVFFMPDVLHEVIRNESDRASLSRFQPGAGTCAVSVTHEARDSVLPAAKVFRMNHPRLV